MLCALSLKLTHKMQKMIELVILVCETSALVQQTEVDNIQVRKLFRSNKYNSNTTYKMHSI